MKEIIIDSDKLEIIGAGHEGTIRKINDNKVCKIIYNLNENKLNKIKELSKIDINNFVFPQKIIFNEEHKPIGYIMEKINYEKDLKNKLYLAKTLTEKIDYLKKIEKNLIEAHKKEIVIVDFNFSNFLVIEDEIKMVDTDNYYYNGLLPDCFPIHYYYLYKEKVSKEFTPDLDKFQFSLKVLETILFKSIHVYNLTTYHPYNKEFEKMLKRLDMDKYMIDFFIQQFSDSKQRPYFKNELDNLKSEKEFIFEK